MVTNKIRLTTDEYFSQTGRALFHLITSLCDRSNTDYKETKRGDKFNLVIKDIEIEFVPLSNKLIFDFQEKKTNGLVDECIELEKENRKLNNK